MTNHGCDHDLLQGMEYSGKKKNEFLNNFKVVTGQDNFFENFWNFSFPKKKKSCHALEFFSETFLKKLRYFHRIPLELDHPTLKLLDP